MYRGQFRSGGVERGVEPCGVVVYDTHRFGSAFGTEACGHFPGVVSECASARPFGIVVLTVDEQKIAISGKPDEIAVNTLRQRTVGDEYDFSAASGESEYGNAAGMDALHCICGDFAKDDARGHLMKAHVCRQYIGADRPQRGTYIYGTAPRRSDRFAPPRIYQISLAGQIRWGTSAALSNDRHAHATAKAAVCGRLYRAFRADP